MPRDTGRLARPFYEFPEESKRILRYLEFEPVGPAYLRASFLFISNTLETTSSAFASWSYSCNWTRITGIRLVVTL